MANMNLDSLDYKEFDQIFKKRKDAFANASERPLPEEYPVNRLARRLHPKRQYLKVAQVTQWDNDCKSYDLVPDHERGTTECAFFSAGQYLSVYLNFDGKTARRAYSISSSPRDALHGKYTLTIKRVQDGIVSPFILDNWKAGTEVEVSGPEGTFDYQPLRDAKTVIGIAGGSGITPFLSMSKAIVEGDEDFNLILLYGSRTADAILFKDKFDELSSLTDKIKVVHVLSDDDKEGFEHGFISEQLIRKYAPQGNYSIFMCGPQVMYRFVDKEIEKLGLEQKYIRHELFGEVHNPSAYADYPKDVPGEVKIVVHIRDKEYSITASSGMTILQSLDANGIAMASRCRSGICGWCHSYLKKGRVYIPKEVDGRRLADEKYGYIHPCCSFPLSDIEIEAPADQ